MNSRPESPRTDASLTMRTIVIFWAPLAATWLMMATEGPLLAALIARLADPKFNLAAYGVAFSLALIVEAPVIMMMSAATALVADTQSYRALRNFNFAIIAAVTACMLVLMIPPVFRAIAIDLLSLPERVASLTHTATMLLLPWPGAIGYRRFYQGIMIRGNRTRTVAYGTLVRLVSMTATAVILYTAGAVDGASVGAIALAIGVTVEAITSRFMARRALRALFASERPAGSAPLGYRAILRFYYPLALTSFLALGIQPIITFFMGKSRHAIESLAVIPVINSLVFIFRSVGLSYQDVTIANLGDGFEHYRPLRRFAVILAITSTGILSVIAFSPIGSWWFRVVSGLSDELAAFAAAPLMIQTIIPATAVLLHFQHAVLVRARRTFPVTIGTILEVFGIVGVLWVTIGQWNVVGAVAAASALVFGRLLANGFLMLPFRRALDARRSESAAFPGDAARADADP
jgi:progressive ankylosis protein